MKLDHDLRRMATELQDSSLLARISGGDLIAIEAKYHFNCLSTFKNKYSAVQRAQHNLTISQEDQLIQAQVFADLISHIEESIESGTCIYKLSELHGMYMSQLKELGIERSVHRTRLKLQILDHFLGECQEQLSDGKSIVLVFNQGMKSMLNRLSPNYAFPRQARGCFTARVTHFCVTAIVPASISYQQQSQVFQELPQRRSDSPVR